MLTLNNTEIQEVFPAATPSILSSYQEFQYQVNVISEGVESDNVVLISTRLNDPSVVVSFTAFGGTLDGHGLEIDTEHGPDLVGYRMSPEVMCMLACAAIKQHGIDYPAK